LGPLNRQLTWSAIRRTAGVYTSARSNGHAVERPAAFRRTRALCLVGQRGRDADVRTDGALSLWTVAGRQRRSYTVPDALKAPVAAAKQSDSLTVIERNGRLLGRVTLTRDVPDPQGVHPVGIDRNETNALVAVDPDGTTFLVSGPAVTGANQRDDKTRQRLHRALARHKAERKDTRSVRRLLNRLGRQRSNRTRTFAHTAAKRLVAFAPAQAVRVCEALTVPQPRKGSVGAKATRRRLSVRCGSAT
jgi:hypothetical protein